MEFRLLDRAGVSRGLCPRALPARPTTRSLERRARLRFISVFHACPRGTRFLCTDHPLWSKSGKCLHLFPLLNSTKPLAPSQSCLLQCPSMSACSNSPRASLFHASITSGALSRPTTSLQFRSILHRNKTPPPC